MFNQIEYEWGFPYGKSVVCPPTDAVMNPVSFARVKLGFNPDPKQEMVLDDKIRRGILNCTRQWGKSTVMAIKALHQAHYRPETLTLVVSPTERQSAMLVQKVRWLAAKKLGVKLKKDGINKASLVFPNGSSVIGLPNSEAGIRGFSDVRLVLIDEAAGVGEDLYNAVTPMLAVSNGTLWLLSTPKGPQGFFYREWMSNEKWMRLAVPATECPRLSKEFLDEERRRKTKRQFLQEYMCDFGGDGTSLFPRELIERSLRKDIKPIELDLSWLKKKRRQE